MSNILVLRNSVSGAGSVSNALIDEALAALRAADPQAAVVNRDLAATPVPHLGASGRRISWRPARQSSPMRRSSNAQMRSKHRALQSTCGKSA